MWRNLYVSPSRRSVARVGAALVADDDVRVLREQVDDLALPLVAPLRPDDHGGGHGDEVCPKPWQPLAARGGPGGRHAETRAADTTNSAIVIAGCEVRPETD